MFKKLHFKIEYLFSYLKKNLVYLVLGLVFGSLVFVFRSKIISYYNQPNFHTTVIGLSGLYTPQKLPEIIQNQLSYGLTSNNENDKPVLSPLIKSLEVNNSNKDYIFHLNPDYYWHNGKNFLSTDINYDFSGITIQPVDNLTLKISLTDPFSPILSLVSQPLFLKDLVGLGPYKLSDITYQDGYVKVMKLQSRDKNKSPLTYRFYSNEKDLFTAFKLGEVDEIETSSLPDEFLNWNHIKTNFTVQVDNRYLAVFLNTEKLNNKQLRQSLAYATPKTKDKNERCTGPVSPLSWAYNPFVKEYNYTPSRAKELFEKNQIEKINLAVVNRELLPIAEDIKTAWNTVLGIDVTVTIENQIDPQNYDAVLAFGGIPHDPDQYIYWHSTQTRTNLTKLNNSRIDKLLEDGRTTFDTQERKRIYQDFQKYLLEESPAIFLSYPITYTTSRIK